MYRYNLMDHIGRVSTYPGRTLGSKPNAFLKCHEMLNPWSMHVQVASSPLSARMSPLLAGSHGFENADEDPVCGGKGVL